MPKLSWGDPGSRNYESGLDRGVLYIDGAAVEWNGLIAVDESPSGGEPRSYYLDGVNFSNVASVEEFKGTIRAFYSPEEFDECDGIASFGKGLLGSQQRRKPFGLSYRTRIGNDVDGIDHGYKIHLVYNALASPANKTYGTLNDSPNPSDLAWSFVTRPEPVDNGLPSAHFVVDTTRASPLAVSDLESVLYGTDTLAPRMPMPAEVLTIIEDYAVMTVTDNGDGTFTVVAPTSILTKPNGTTFNINAASAAYLDADTYTISSY